MIESDKNKAPDGYEKPAQSPIQSISSWEDNVLEFD